MMKREVLMATLALGAPVLSATPARATESVAESRFHLVTMRCESEAEDGPETTPQSPPNCQQPMPTSPTDTPL